MLKLNFHHLYYFHVIAEQGQIARAAKRLRIGQPALSTQLKNLEQALGVTLFDRKRGQALALTRHGEILQRYTREIFRLSDEMLLSLKGLRADTTLNLNVGALDWLPKREVSEVMSAILKRFDCFISVIEDTAAHLIELLEQRKIDLVITNSPAPSSKEIQFRAHRVAALPVVICGAPKFAKLKKGFPRSLNGQPMILPTSHGKTRFAIDDTFRNQGINVKVVGEAQDGELLRLAALSGDALVPLSPSTIAEEIRRKDLIAVGTLEGVFEEIWLIATARFVDHPIISFVMSQLGNQFKVFKL